MAWIPLSVPFSLSAIVMDEQKPGRCRWLGGRGRKRETLMEDEKERRV